MIEALNQKIVSITHPAAIYDDASLTTAYVDTLGWDFLTIVLDLGATDVALTAFKAQECETSGGSYTDIANSVYGGTGLPALPTGTGDNQFFAIHIDLRNKGRFIDTVVTFGNGTAGGYASVFGILSRGKEAPNSAAERGFAAEAFC